MDHYIRQKYTAVIGLEVHAQLMTHSKIFAGDNAAYGGEPNTQISVITLGHPGTLPKLNKKAVEHAIRMGLACHCEISRENIFDRKNYFYPDLPKGYQVTQDKTPICVGGFVPVKTKDGEEVKIRLTKIHLEEDAGKSLHLENEPDTLVDFNRAGVPLIEIVTEPDLRTSEQAAAFLTEIRKLVRYLDICDGNMEEGSMRCDANISIMPDDATEYGQKVEVKNMNSIRNVQRAIDHEIERQIGEVESGRAIISETRTFNANTGTTSGMRVKEELTDYRYFPEPDLCPMVISEEWLGDVKASMPSLPHELYHKFVHRYELPEYDAEVLTDTKEMAFYFDALCQETKNYKAASNWMMGPVKSYLNDCNDTIREFPLTPAQIAEIISLVEQNKLSYTTASQQVFLYLLKHPENSALEAAHTLNLLQDSRAENINPLIEEVLADFPAQVTAYKKGKKGLLGLFVGEVMKRSKGKANPRMANQLIKEALD
jgi:aspartyl-tRNA(Asn)/glutamyl-tRNA(Gln) amidotransferase subunit B